MKLENIENITVSDSGTYNITYDPATQTLPDLFLIFPDTGTPRVTFTMSFASTPPNGSYFRVIFDGVNITGSITIFGLTFTPTGAYSITDFWVDTTGSLSFMQWVPIASGLPTSYNEFINGAAILANTLSPGALDNATAGYILVANSSGVYTSMVVSGDVHISDTGATTIQSSAVVDSKVSSSAAIQRSKLATDTANAVAINNSGGVLTSEAQLASVRGGLGIDASSSTGFPSFLSGTASIGAFADNKSFTVSFNSGYQSDNKIKMPFAGTITGIYAYAVEAIAGTDNGTITPKNNAGTTMTSGTITFMASDTQGTAYTSSPSANNTFVAGDILSFTTSKSTAGGAVLLTISYNRYS